VNPQPLTDAPCGTIVYRQIRRKDWFDPDDDSKVMAEAFMRRRPTVRKDGIEDLGDNDGLSVYDSFRIQKQACMEDSESCHGLVTLHVGTLRDLGLNVIRDPSDNRKILITDMPFTNPDDERQETLLESVARSARIEVRYKWQRPRTTKAGEHG
jgi:hypothetical protein